MNKKIHEITTLMIPIGLLVLYPLMENVFWFRYVFLFALTVPLVLWGPTINFRENMFLFLFILWSATTVLWSSFVFETIYEWLQLFFFLYVFAFYLSKVDFRKRESIFAIVVLIVSSYGILQFFGIDYFNTQHLAGNRIISTIGNPNFLAGVLAPSFAYFFVRAVKYRGGAWIIPVPIFLALLMTRSRAGIVFALMSVVLVLIFAHRLKFYMTVIIGLIVLMAIIFNFQRFISIKGEIKGFQGTTAERMIMWMVTLDMWRNNPFGGTGYGTFKNNYPLYQSNIVRCKVFHRLKSHARHGHSLYFELLAVTGVVGFALFMVFVIGFLKQKNIPLEAKAGSLVLFLHSLVSVVFFYPSIMVMLAFFVSFAFGTKGAGKSGRSWLSSLAVKLILMLLAFSGLIIFAREYIAQIEVTRYNALKGTDKGRFGYLYLKKAQRLAPQFVNSSYYLGNFYARKGNADLAIDAYRKGLQANPSYEEFYYNLALTYAEKNRLNEAIYNYRQAVEIAPLFFEAYFNLALLYVNNRADYHSAIGIFRYLNYVNPKNVDVLINLGYCYERLNNTRKARYFYEKAVTLDPGSKKAKANLAYILGQTRRPVEARKEITALVKELDEMVSAQNWNRALQLGRKILDIQPDNEKVLLYMGNIYSLKGDYGQAMKYYRELIEVNPLSSSAYSNIGYIHYSRGEKEDAIYYFKRAVELNPHFKAGYKNLINLYLEMNRLNEAKAVAKRALQYFDDPIFRKFSK